MNCPACATRQTLLVTTSPEGLRIRRCLSCDGCWIRSQDYWRWMSGRDPETSGRGSHGVPTPSAPEELEVRFCPEDGEVLARFEVGTPHAFLIDQCRNCSGVWLDAGEWEALCDGGLADRLHLILSEEWQDELQVRRGDAGDDQPWHHQLDAADLARVSEIKAWLDGHPQSRGLYSFLRSSQEWTPQSADGG